MSSKKEIAKEEKELTGLAAPLLDIIFALCYLFLRRQLLIDSIFGFFRVCAKELSYAIYIHTITDFCRLLLQF